MFLSELLLLRNWADRIRQAGLTQLLTGAVCSPGPALAAMRRSYLALQPTFVRPSADNVSLRQLQSQHSHRSLLQDIDSSQYKKSFIMSVLVEGSQVDSILVANEHVLKYCARQIGPFKEGSAYHCIVEFSTMQVSLPAHAQAH